MSRQAKGRDLADNFAVQAIEGGGYRINQYVVDADVSECSCRDFEFRGGQCKHILAVGYAEESGCIAHAGHDDDAGYPVDFDDMPF